MSRLWSRAVMAVVVGVSVLMTRPADAFVVVCANCSEVVTQIAEYAKQVEQFREMLNQTQLMTNQLTQLQAQFQSITGGRGFGGINVENYQRLVPIGYENLLNVIDHYELVGFMAQHERDLLSQQDQPYMQSHVDIETQLRMTDEIRRAATTKALNERLYEGSTDRFTRIDSLRLAIDETTDLKGIAEVQARLTAENVSAVNELIKLQSMNALLQSQDERQRIWYRQRNYMATATEY